VDFLAMPEVELAVSTSQAGRAIEANMRRPLRAGVAKGTFGVGVLGLPDSLTTYLRGRERQALRTNVRRAEEAGIVCADLPPGSQRALVVHQLQDRGEFTEPHWAEELESADSFAIATGPDGGLFAVSATHVDGPVAMIVCFVSLGDGPQYSHARYALHKHLVGRLIDAGVQTVCINDCTLMLPPGLPYFQRRLGFVLRRVRLVRSRARDVLVTHVVPAQRDERDDRPGAEPSSVPRLTEHAAPPSA
jgi:hypothetical protein